MHTIAILPYIPCGAKLPVFLTFLSPLFANPFPAICLLYFSGLGLSLALSYFLKGSTEGMICEIAPINTPQFTQVKNKLFFYVKGFIIKMTTYVTIFCAISWVLSHFSFTFEYVQIEGSALSQISRLLLPLFYPMGIKDWRLAYAAFTGFAAKENVAATIAMFYPEGLHLGLNSSLAMCVFFLTCPACISAFAASVKEIGWTKTVKYNILQLCLAFILAYLTNLLISLL
jgi:ferrous iron transport protein B